MENTGDLWWKMVIWRGQKAGVHFRMCDEKEKWMTLECDGAWKFEASKKVGKRQGTGNHNNLENL